MAESAAVVGFFHHPVAAAIEYQVALAAEQNAGTGAAGGHAEPGVRLPLQRDGLAAGAAAAKGQVVVGGAVKRGDYATKVNDSAGANLGGAVAPIGGVIKEGVSESVGAIAAIAAPGCALGDVDIPSRANRGHGQQQPTDSQTSSHHTTSLGYSHQVEDARRVENLILRLYLRASFGNGELERPKGSKKG